MCFCCGGDLVYARKHDLPALWTPESNETELYQEMDILSYSCGSSYASLHPETDFIFNKVFINKRLTCQSPMEIPYYSSFPLEPLCFFCGTDSDLFDYDASTHLPLCQECRDSGSQFEKKRGKATFTPQSQEF